MNELSRAKVASPRTPAPSAQRRYMRYSAAEDQAWLGWWEGRVYRKSPATLVDISHGGAKVIAEVPPPRRSTIYICLDGEHRTEWVEAEVLEVVRLADRTAQVRMAFRELCPYSFFEVAVFGRSRATTTKISANAGTALASSRVGW